MSEFRNKVLQRLSEERELPSDMMARGLFPTINIPQKGEHVDFYHQGNKHYGKVKKVSGDDIHIEHPETKETHKFKIVKSNPIPLGKMKRK